MTGRRILGILAITLAAIGGIALMVGYTKRVDERIRKAPAERTNVALLKDRAAIPPLTGVDLDGRPVSTASLRGKVVIVNFWATWCGPCRAEVPDLVELQKKYADQLQIIGLVVDDDDEGEIKKFVDEF